MNQEKAILDVEIWDNKVAILFEKNCVQVYDLASSSPAGKPQVNEKKAAKGGDKKEAEKQF